MLRATADWCYQGMDAVMLENKRIRATILPGAGARIFQLIDKQNDVDLLWHHPRRGPQPAVLGSPGADLWWSGGIDDIFPTDFPCLYRNEQLPYLGELWTNTWSSRLTQADDAGVEVLLSTRTVISPFEVTKRIRLEGEDDHISVRYAITNIGFSAYDWFFGIHPGVEVEEGCRLLFPIREALIDDAWPLDVLAAKGTRYAWPLCPTARGGTIDLSQVPGPEGWWTFQYGMELAEPWLAVHNPARQSAFGIAFDRGFFKSLLFYLGFGGWRNTYSVIPQIATAWPGNLSEVVASGMQRSLQPGESATTEVSFHCLTGVRDEAAVRTRLRGI
jgi:hypothetical protein